MNVTHFSQNPATVELLISIVSILGIRVIGIVDIGLSEDPDYSEFGQYMEFSIANQKIEGLIETSKKNKQRLLLTLLFRTITES